MPKNIKIINGKELNKLEIKSLHTHVDISELSRSQNATLNRGEGRGSNIKYNPYAFTEQGIYMLMTVLRG